MVKSHVECSSELVWQCVKKNNAFVRASVNRTRFSAERGNVTNKHSYAASGAQKIDILFFCLVFFFSFSFLFVWFMCACVVVPLPVVRLFSPLFFQTPPHSFVSLEGEKERMCTSVCVCCVCYVFFYVIVKHKESG